MDNRIEYTFNPDYTLITPKEYNAVEVVGEECRVPESQSPGSCEVYEFTSAEALATAPVEILSVSRLPCTWRSVYKIRLNHTSDYVPGDAIGLVVPNSDELVDRLFAACGLRDFRCTLTRSGLRPFRFAGRLRDFFKYRCDLAGLPRKIHLLGLARTATLRTHLEYLCSREGARDYARLGTNWNSIVDVIECFGCRPSVADLVRNCEFIKPRYFSLVNARHLVCEIVLGVMSRGLGDSLRLGHVSGHVHRLPDRSTGAVSPFGCAEVLFRKNMLFDPSSMECLVAFCTGTGVAPFLSFWNNKRPGQELVLVYGFRNDEDDLTRYYSLGCPIIRAKSSGGARVTDHVSVLDGYKDRCHVFICGNMKMQRSVYEKIKAMHPLLVESKRVFFDNWQ